MDSKAILEKLKEIYVTDADYEIFTCEGGKHYFGKDKEYNTIFVIPSNSPNVPPVVQTTNSLVFSYNKKCSFIFEGTTETRIVHLFTCKEHSREKLHAFIRLTRAFSSVDTEADQFCLARLFTSLSALFDKQCMVSENELQGLFAELYSILHFQAINCDIAHFWQSRTRMKFDFSINNRKRIEIKSTIKNSRTHHFKHDQLLSEMYDIKIVSVMLKKNDCGISIGELVEQVREKYMDNYELLMRVESIVTHITNEQLEGAKFDEKYLTNNLRYFDAKRLPRFHEKTPEGVYNAEYDCALDNLVSISESDLCKWIKENSDV